MNVLTALGFLGLLLIFPFPVFAGSDQIELKDGTVLQGHIVARNTFQFYVDTGGEDGVVRVDVRDIETIHFGPVAAEEGSPSR